MESPHEKVAKPEPEILWFALTRLVLWRSPRSSFERLQPLSAETLAAVAVAVAVEVAVEVAVGRGSRSRSRRGSGSASGSGGGGGGGGGSGSGRW